MDLESFVSRFSSKACNAYIYIRAQFTFRNLKSIKNSISTNRNIQIIGHKKGIE